MHILCKAHQILNFNHLSVVQNRLSAHTPEHLMLVCLNNHSLRLCLPVKHRQEIHLKPSVTGRKFPRLHIIPFWDMKRHIIQLMRLSVIVQHILRCRRSIPEPVSNIEPKGLPVRVSKQEK